MVVVHSGKRFFHDLVKIENRSGNRRQKLDGIGVGIEGSERCHYAPINVKPPAWEGGGG